MFILLFFTILLGNALCVPNVIVNLNSGSRGGVITQAQNSFDSGYNFFYVPVQKTLDMYPRVIVSSVKGISEKTMLDLSQEHDAVDIQRPPLLGEFLGVTSSFLEHLVMPVSSLQDIDYILHDLTYSSRRNTAFEMALIVNSTSSLGNIISIADYFRKTVPDGRITVHDYNCSMSCKNGDVLKSALDAIGTDRLAVDIDLLSLYAVKMMRNMNITIGALNADTFLQIQKAMDLPVDFMHTSNIQAFSFLKTKPKVSKGHATVILG